MNAYPDGIEQRLALQLEQEREGYDEDDEYLTEAELAARHDEQFDALTDTVRALLEVVAASRNDLPLDQWATVDRLVKNGHKLLAEVLP